MGKIKDFFIKIFDWLLQPKTINWPPFVWLVLLIVVGIFISQLQIIKVIPGEGQDRFIVVTPTPGADVATPTPIPTPVGSGGTLAFAMRHNGNSDIYLLPQDAGEVLRLTYDPAEDRDPAWSPDGQWLAFASRRAGNWDLYLMDMTSNTVIRLTRTPHYEAGPSWSPDSQWLAYECYEDGNLDINIISQDGKEHHRLTTDSAPDYAPAWSTDGRHIAFTSFREGNKDIYLISLDNGEVVNLTHTPDQDEDYATWSPQGDYLAYSAGNSGDETIWILPFDREALTTGELRPILFGSGGQPAWSPDGQAMAFISRKLNTSYLIAASNKTGWAMAQEGYSTHDWLEKPVWTETPLRPEMVNRLRAQMKQEEPPLYTELLLNANTVTTYQLVTLPNVNGGNEQLSDKVNDSYNAMRRRVEEETGWDYLSILGDSYRVMNHTPRPGQGRISWHVCGRAVDINQGYLGDGRIELVKEEVGGVTFWRVYIKAKEQDGSMGEPLRAAPWSLHARNNGGLAAMEGGELKPIPEGYYVDFTMIAADYGWERRNALSNWRNSWFDIEWWHFQKTEGLSWYGCMLEMYSSAAISDSYGTLPWWTTLPEWEVESMPW
ncbi:MAG: PD40 domain-containing protein [Anaerolineae bacterium]|nr:PD40 domain-containing protein [Anaerolineae bacterium]